MDKSNESTQPSAFDEALAEILKGSLPKEELLKRIANTKRSGSDKDKTEENCAAEPEEEKI